MQHASHILVIRLSAMGDVAMSLPVLKVLTETYPHLKITLLTRAFFAPIFEELPNVRVFEADVKGRHKGLLGLRRLAEELRKQEIEAVADLHNVLRSNILKRFFRLYGLRVKQIDKGRAEKKALTRKENKIFRQLKTTHQRYADVFAALGYPVALSGFCPLERKKLSENLKQITGPEPQKWVGIAPFAQHAAKMYPRKSMKEVIRKLSSEKDLKIFLFGAGNQEKAILSQWESEFESVINMAGRVTFAEELALISHLDAMISMDSGNGHLAANFGIPVISLWGLTHPYTGFAPFGQPESNSLLPDLEKYPQIPTSIYGNKIPAGYEAAMASILPEMVVEKVLDVLGKDLTVPGDLTGPEDL